MLSWLLDDIMCQMADANVPTPERVWQEAAMATRGSAPAFIIVMALAEFLAACQELTPLMLGMQPSSTCIYGKASQAAWRHTTGIMHEPCQTAEHACKLPCLRLALS